MICFPLEIPELMSCQKLASLVRFCGGGHERGSETGCYALIQTISEIIWLLFPKKYTKRRDERGSDTGCYTSIRPRNYLALFPEKYTKKDTNRNMKLDVMR